MQHEHLESHPQWRESQEVLLVGKAKHLKEGPMGGDTRELMEMETPQGLETTMK